MGWGGGGELQKVEEQKKGGEISFVSGLFKVQATGKVHLRDCLLSFTKCRTNIEEADQTGNLRDCLLSLT